MPLKPKPHYNRRSLDFLAREQSLVVDSFTSPIIKAMHSHLMRTVRYINYKCCYTIAESTESPIVPISN